MNPSSFPRTAVRLVSLLLVAACQPQARRVLLLDLALSDPVVLNGTARPWTDAGYEAKSRRFYPPLTRAALPQSRTLLSLLGREPEAASDALTAGDVALLDEWVRRGGVVVLGYDGDGEGYLDRWTANRWLAYEGAGISIGDRVLEDTTLRVVTTGRMQPWVVAQPVGDEPLGSAYDPFPLDRNHAVVTRQPTHRAARALQAAPLPVELQAPRLAPPDGVETIDLPLVADKKYARPANVPDWLRQQGLRVLWTPLLATRDEQRVPRPHATLDSLVTFLDVGGFNLLSGDAYPEGADSMHARWWERDAVRRAWSDAVSRLGPTSVAWIPAFDYGGARLPPADSSRGPRGEALPGPCEKQACCRSTIGPSRTKSRSGPVRSGTAFSASGATFTSRSAFPSRRRIGSRSACSRASPCPTGRSSCSRRRPRRVTCSGCCGRAG